MHNKRKKIPQLWIEILLLTLAPSPFKPICHVSTSELQPAAFPSLNTLKNKWVNMKLISWKIGALRLRTRTRHTPPLGEMVRPHLHGGENSPAYIIQPLQLISGRASPISHISHWAISSRLIMFRELFVSANSNGSISSCRGQNIFIFVQIEWSYEGVYFLQQQS